MNWCTNDFILLGILVVLVIIMFIIGIGFFKFNSIMQDVADKVKRPIKTVGDLMQKISDKAGESIDKLDSEEIAKYHKRIIGKMCVLMDKVTPNNVNDICNKAKEAICDLSCAGCDVIRNLKPKINVDIISHCQNIKYNNTDGLKCTDLSHTTNNTTSNYDNKEILSNTITTIDNTKIDTTFETTKETHIFDKCENEIFEECKDTPIEKCDETFIEKCDDTSFTVENLKKSNTFSDSSDSDTFDCTKSNRK